jgi:hypothetical protein
MRYADVEYFGVLYKDAEFLNRRWYFERRHGEVTAFKFQTRVKLLTEPSDQPRYRNKLRPRVRIFGSASEQR